VKKRKPVFEGKLRLRKGDEVIVLSGKDKGKRGKIIQTIPEDGKVIVDGVNVVTRHRRPRSSSSRAMIRQQLGEMQVPLGLPVSKVMLVCPKCNKETRMSRTRSPEGGWERTCRKCGEFIDS
jgi:large subunit ribosomal protein L24